MTSRDSSLSDDVPSSKPFRIRSDDRYINLNGFVEHFHITHTTVKLLTSYGRSPVRLSVGTPTILTQFYNGFPQSLQTNTGILPWNRPHTLPSIRFFSPAFINHLTIWRCSIWSYWQPRYVSLTTTRLIFVSSKIDKFVLVSLSYFTKKINIFLQYVSEIIYTQPATSHAARQLRPAGRMRPVKELSRLQHCPNISNDVYYYV
jgi:hypothetical protein